MNKIFELRFGSHLYGTNTENSDLDLKSIYIPEGRQIVLNKYQKTITTCRPKAEFERNNKDDIDLEIFSLDQFLKLLSEGQTLALDVVHAPLSEFTYINPDLFWVFQTIVDNKEKLLSKNVSAFIGYARMQAAKYGVKGSRMDVLKRTLEVLDGLHLHTKVGDHEEAIRNLIKECDGIVSLEKTPLIQLVDLPGADKKTMVPHIEVCDRYIPFGASVKFAKEVLTKIYEGYGNRARKAHLAGGVDWKALSHAVRVNSEGLELLRTGNITFPRPDADLLLKIKTGQLPFEEVSEMITNGLSELMEAQKISTLRDKPDTEWMEDFIENIYTGSVLSNYMEYVKK